jgi:hypothetical protein
MSNAPIIQNFAKNLRQPAWIASLASIGIHGLLWAVLPILPLSSKPAELEEKRRTVQLVELTPEDLSKVPQFAQPQSLYPIDPIPKSILPSSPSTQPSPLPSIDPSLLYPLPITPPPPVTSWSWNLPVERPKITTRITPEPKRTTTKITPERTDPAKPDPTKPGETAKKDEQPKTEQSDTAKPGAEDLKPTAPVRPNQIPPEAIAKLQEARKQMEAKVGYNPGRATKSNEEYSKNVAELGPYFTELVKDVPGDKLEEKEFNPQKVTFYPEEACPFKLNGVTEVWALVKPNGEVEGEPKIALYSAFNLLNDAAFNYVKNNQFKKSEKYEVRQFRFEFKPTEETCPASKSQPVS